MATVEHAEPQPRAGDGLVMGHVHLHVGDMARAIAFYETLGMERMAEMPSAAFLAAGGYHHHLGVNTWQGEGVGPAPRGTVGLRRWTIVLPQAADVAATAAGRAMRLIADGVVDREGVDGLSRRVGYTPRHLSRLLTAELGAGPLALARARRAQTARVLIETTDGQRSWSTVGVGANLLEASWEALTDSAIYGLIHAGVDPR